MGGWVGEGVTWVGGGDVVGVARGPVARQLAVDVRTAGARASAHAGFVCVSVCARGSWSILRVFGGYF